MKQLATGIGAVALGTVLIVSLGTAAIGGDAASASAPGLRSGAVPDQFVPWIDKAAALCPEDESPPLIAAQIWAESNFQDREGPPTEYGTAKGYAQFIDSSWATWGRDDDGNGDSSPHDIGDSVMALGRYMCALFDKAKKSGYPGGAEALALAGYNAGWGKVQHFGGVPPYRETTDYISKIVARTAEWTVSTPAVIGSGSGADAVRKAATYVGIPYAWGGGTPAGPSVGRCEGNNGYQGGQCAASTTVGFDCSSLVQNAWWPTLHLPRTAGDQYTATAARQVPMNSLQPGDLIFYSHDGINGANAYHVVMYYGGGKVIEAPRTGKNVRIVKLYKSGGLVGATRPS